MSLIKFNRNRLPWFNGDITDWMSTEGFFEDEFF